MSDLINSLSRNLRGYWCPMLQYGGLTLRDQTRFKNNGTLTNFDATIGNDWIMSRVSCRSGRVLDFDGTNDHVNILSNQKISGLDSLTVSAWVKISALPAAAQGNRMWIFTKLDASNAEWELSVNPFNNSVVPYGRFAFTSYNLAGTSSRLRGSLTAPQVGFWYHVAVTQIERTASPNIYVQGSLDNGALGAIGTPVAGSGTAPIQLGRRANGSDVLFNGQIAEAAIWNRALNPGEIQELYRLGPGWYQPQLPRRIPYSEQQAGFKAYWARRQSQLIGGGV